MSKFVYLLVGVIILLSGCIYDSPSLKNPSATIEGNNQRIVMTAEEARRLYNAQVEQRTADNPFYDEKISVNKNKTVSKNKTSNATTKIINKSKDSSSGVKVIKKSTLSPQSNLKCGSYPRTCGKMTSCSQAKAALKCGNRSLDRDNDGIPCESICGG